MRLRAALVFDADMGGACQIEAILSDPWLDVGLGLLADQPLYPGAMSNRSELSTQGLQRSVCDADRSRDQSRL